MRASPLWSRQATTMTQLAITPLGTFRLLSLWAAPRAPTADVTSAMLAIESTSGPLECTMSGTSMSCPHVAGAAALLLEADPSKKASTILQDLLDSSHKGIITELTGSDQNALQCVAEGG